MTPEHRLMNEIRLFCGEKNYICIRMNIGTFYTKTGQIINAGISDGFPDLLILAQGKCLFIETKIKPRRPTEAQINWQKCLRERGYISGTVYSLDEFILLLLNNNID